jgi:large subunit ribosomal protein L29
MRLRDVKTLKDKKEADLKEQLKSASDELFKARIKHGVGQLDKTTSLRELRRDIARIHNRLREMASAPKE